MKREDLKSKMEDSLKDAMLKGLISERSIDGALDIVLNSTIGEIIALDTLTEIIRVEFFSKTASKDIAIDARYKKDL